VVDSRFDPKLICGVRVENNKIFLEDTDYEDFSDTIDGIKIEEVSESHYDILFKNELSRNRDMMMKEIRKLQEKINDMTRIYNELLIDNVKLRNLVDKQHDEIQEYKNTKNEDVVGEMKPKLLLERCSVACETDPINMIPRVIERKDSKKFIMHLHELEKLLSKESIKYSDDLKSLGKSGLDNLIAHSMEIYKISASKSMKLYINAVCRFIDRFRTG
jgi:hypothetical protein